MNYSQYELLGELNKEGNLYLNIQIAEQSGAVNYTELGVFISGLLLSLGGCFALVFSNLRKSNCSDIELGCFRCKRENLNIQE